MESIVAKSLELQRQAHRLLFLEDDAPMYSDVFTRQNGAVLSLSNELYSLWRAAGSIIPEEEADVCLSLLMGYNATIYDDGDKQARIQEVLDRCWHILERLPSSLLKVRLLTYCYAEVYDDGLAEEAHAIMDGWRKDSLAPEEREMIELLRGIEENPYPWVEVEE